MTSLFLDSSALVKRYIIENGSNWIRSLVAPGAGNVSLEAAILQLSEDLLERHPLRAYDALQLASAMTVQSRLSINTLPPLTFISADVRLLTVASAEGLLVDDPSSHP
jgi:hypothetical protein